MANEIEIKIILNPQTGEAKVTGNIQDEILTYGLIEKGKEILRRFYENLKAGKAQPDMFVANGPMKSLLPH